MHNFDNELERWLAGEDIFAEHDMSMEIWLADFDADRQAVLLKLGPYKKIYLRPPKFTKRFYHQLFPLKIEHWDYRKQLALFDDFCSIDLQLDLRFQASLAYVQKNSELLATINQHIKQTYADLIDDIVNRELLSLADGLWVQTGLSALEKSIANAVCALFAVQHIQSQALCTLVAGFAEFPDVQLGRQHVYLHVLKKTYEITEQKNREMIRQQRLLDQQKIMEKQLQLEHQQELIALEVQAQAIAAEKQRRLLAEQQAQLVEQLALEKELYAEKLRHEAELKEMLLESELRMQEKQQAKQRLVESRLLNDQLLHEAYLEDKKVVAELRRREQMQSRLDSAELAGDAVAAKVL